MGAFKSKEIRKIIQHNGIVKRAGENFARASCRYGQDTRLALAGVKDGVAEIRVTNRNLSVISAFMNAAQIAEVLESYKGHESPNAMVLEKAQAALAGKCTP